MARCSGYENCTDRKMLERLVESPLFPYVDKHAVCMAYLMLAGCYNKKREEKTC